MKFSRFAAVFLGMILVVALVSDLLFRSDSLVMRESKEESKLYENEDLRTKNASKTHIAPSLAGVIWESFDENLAPILFLGSLSTKIQLPPCLLGIFFERSPPLPH